MRNIAQRVAEWWHGKYIAPARDSDVTMFKLMGPYDRHWTSHVAHLVWDLYLEHWKFVIGATVAVILAIAQIE